MCFHTQDNDLAMSWRFDLEGMFDFDISRNGGIGPLTRWVKARRSTAFMSVEPHDRETHTTE